MHVLSWSTSDSLRTALRFRALRVFIYGTYDVVHLGLKRQAADPGMPRSPEQLREAKAAVEVRTVVLRTQFLSFRTVLQALIGTLEVLKYS